MKLSAPGNVLLLGEYAVTEEGGLGVAVGSGPRAVATISPFSRLTLIARMGEGSRRWPAEELPLMSAAVEIFKLRRLPLPTGAITLDTTAFYAGERKLGFGSSAAAAVVLTAALLAAPDRNGESVQDRADGPDGLPHGDFDGFAPLPPEERLFDLALAIHRQLQGGRGSGSDVAASLLGGLIRFRGGKSPEAERLELPWLPGLTVIAGEEAVATGGSLSRYNRWKERKPAEAKRFLKESNRLVRSFVESEGWGEAFGPVLEAKRLGERIGEQIGVPARFEAGVRVGNGGSAGGHADRWDSPAERVVKAVGAGAEMGVLFASDETPAPTGAVPLDPQERGLSWE